MSRIQNEHKQRVRFSLRVRVSSQLFNHLLKTDTIDILLLLTAVPSFLGPWITDKPSQRITNENS